ncbi:MAG: response regulator transcription factor [Ardenticatenaceae bacterium]|nr:response regulator transcription factor [Ardenticatenaceae bacterium]
MDTIRLILVDDHPVVREGLAGMLAGQPDFDVVATATDGSEALRLDAEHIPDVILMDLRMPGMDGVTAIGAIKGKRPSANILVLTTYDSDADILRAIEAGATGYLLKDTPREELYRAIRAAANGESVLAPAVAARLMTRMRAPAEENLSAREIEVLQLVAKGASNRAIGKELHISTATVKTHLIHIFNKLGVDDRTAAVTAALERQIITLNN